MVQARLTAKGIHPSKYVVVYGYTPMDAARTADRLRRLGYQRVLEHAEGVAAWAADNTLPMDRLPRYE